MNEPEWQRKSRLKQEAWSWAAKRLRLEVVVEEVEGDLSADQQEMLDHVRTVICKNLERQAERISAKKRGKR